MATKATPSTDQSTEDTGLSGAAERLRQSARWFVVAFGAVTAAVFTGVSVSDFGDVRFGTAAFWVAVGAAVVALVATIAAMLMAVSLAAASTVSVDELRSSRRRGDDRDLTAAVRSLAFDPALKTWQGDLAKFFDEVDEANESHLKQLAAWRDSTSLQATKTWADRWAIYLQTLSNVQTVVMSTASYLRLRARFQRTGWWMGLALAFAAGGTLLFSIVTRQAVATDVATRALPATWDVPADQRADVADLRGVGCAQDMTALSVIVLDDDNGGERDILVLPAAHCAAIRRTVSQDELTFG
ncbi:MAG TPA: hypothetical protein VH333_24270 [Pseudonocardiaceae bacterium]|jgi:hypothetical protein|nr:hypothetical protein [Pseudonocardiaceae bacterium]